MSRSLVSMSKPAVAARAVDACVEFVEPGVQHVLADRRRSRRSTYKGWARMLRGAP